MGDAAGLYGCSYEECGGLLLLPFHRYQLCPTVAGMQIRLVRGLLIREMRETKGYGLNEFARLIGISAAHLSRIEQGHRNPQPPVTAAIARGLGCTVEDITERVAA